MDTHEINRNLPSGFIAEFLNEVVCSLGVGAKLKAGLHDRHGSPESTQLVFSNLKFMDNITDDVLETKFD